MRRKGCFGETHWSEIIASRTQNLEKRQKALDRLLTRYRRPVILYIQWKQRISATEAEELAHEFIHHWIRAEIHRKASPQGGRFRNFLKSCIDNFLIGVARSKHASKRNGEGKSHSLDEEIKDREPIQMADQSHRELSAIMDRAWAEQVVQSALAQLQAECEDARRGHVFALLKPALSCDPDGQTYSECAEKLGITVQNVKTTVYRLRKRLHELIRQEVKQTVGNKSDWEDELRYLICLMGTNSTSRRWYSIESTSLMVQRGHCSRCGSLLTEADSNVCPQCLLSDALELGDTEAHDLKFLGELPADADQVTSSSTLLKEQFESRQIGRYKLLEKLGEGGFGEVWMAEQKEPVLRRVALKIIKLGMDTRQVIARFEAERQALAQMDHPNIAKVFDAGATDSGRPFFVMELVRGVATTEYCDKNRLSPRERLELVVSVCQAIQHAHQKGIIHRDIKPSNVLV
jgi:RNA polymerase sigma factor (sigma-70 family)